MALDQYGNSPPVTGDEGIRASLPTNDVAGSRKKTGSSATEHILRPPSTKFAVAIAVLLIMMQLPQTTPKELQKLLCDYLKFKKDCLVKLEETWKTIPSNETWCPGEFDGYLCWDHGTPNLLSSVNCPFFIDWNNDTLLGHRFCTSNGTWLHRPDHNGVMNIWEHRGNCHPFLNSPEYDTSDPGVDNEMSLINALKITYTAGYSISLVCLIIALFILAFLKKLHCTRNYIHINLMISFIIRYMAVIIKDKVMDVQYNFKPNMTMVEMEAYCDDFGGVSPMMVSCRLAIIMMHYAIMANYFWLLAEGVYLQLILVFAMTDYKYFPVFMAFGWGAPWLPIGVWISLRLTFENTGCWEIFDNSNIWWVLRAPVIISIAINFIIFINIIRIIVAKLRANNMSRTDYKYRLARSTLALIPLLGIHYIVFLVITDEVVGPDNVAMHVKTAFEIVFTSIQGTLIAILYCFLNGEVQTEVAQIWRNWRWRNGLPRARKYSSNINGTQMTSVTCGSTETSAAHHDTSYLPPPDRREPGITTRRSTTDNSVCESTQPLMGNGHSREQRPYCKV